MAGSKVTLERYTGPRQNNEAKSLSSSVIALSSTPALCSLWELAQELNALFLSLNYTGMPTSVTLLA